MAVSLNKAQQMNEQDVREKLGTHADMLTRDMPGHERATLAALSTILTVREMGVLGKYFARVLDQR